MDLQVIENAGNGGDLVKKPKDLSVIEGFQNMPYLAMFGGNTAASTGKRIPSEQAFDWYANSLIFSEDATIQFNSETERALNNTPLTSSGRAIIENAVKADLKFMKAFCQVGVSVTIPETDKVVIGIRLIEPDNLEQRDHIFIWDATRQELNLAAVSSGVSGGSTVNGFFDYFFDFDFI